MLNDKPRVVAKLKTILPTYYELSCNSDTPKPCITYNENFNADDVISKERGYSRVQMTLKVWLNGTDIGEATTYVQSIDTAMRDLGYRRVSSIELFVGGQIEKVLIYEALGIENY